MFPLSLKNSNYTLNDTLLFYFWHANCPLYIKSTIMKKLYTLLFLLPICLISCEGPVGPPGPPGPAGPQGEDGINGILGQVIEVQADLNADTGFERSERNVGLSREVFFGGRLRNVRRDTLERLGVHLRGVQHALRPHDARQAGLRDASL